MKRTNIMIVVVVMLAVLGLMLVGCGKDEQPAPPKAELNEWLGQLSDDTPITKIALPGSHDSGTVGMMPLAETQGASIGEQLEYGVRYFDIRVSKNKNGGRIFHGPIKGVPFPPIVDDIASFVKAHPSEFLILDFQHFDGNGADTLVYDTLKAKGILDIAMTNDTALTDSAYMDSLTLGEVRGKVLVFFGSGLADSHANIFRRNNDECTRDDSSLDSLYLGDDHKKGSEHFLDVAMKKYFDHILAKKSGILVLQGQLTGGNVRAEEAKHSDNMNAFTRNIKDNPAYLESVNVVMRDFVETDSEKVLSTMSLNYYKGYVKSECTSAYMSLCSIN